MNTEIVPPYTKRSMLYIRPVVFGCGSSMQLKPSEEYLFCVYVTAAGAFYDAKALNCLVLEEFDRAAPHGTGSGKVAGNYAPVLRWAGDAKGQGYDITLHLDSQTRTEIEEFSTSAFIGVKTDGQTTTLIVPDTENVVSSVTSDSVQQLARSFGWNVIKQPVSNNMRIFLDPYP
jgi:branched-chain amino acid aminotransferase